MEIVLGTFIGWAIGTLLVRAYINYSENRSKRKKKNYNKFRK